MSRQGRGDSVTPVFTSASLGQRAFHILSRLTHQSTKFWRALRGKCMLTFFFPKCLYGHKAAQYRGKSTKWRDFPDDAVDKSLPANQGTRVQSLGWEDSTSPRATKPMPRNYWSLRCRDQVLQLLNLWASSLCSVGREATAMINPRTTTATQSSPPKNHWVKIKRACHCPGWNGSLGENGYLYMDGWVPLLSTWNYHNIVHWLYSKTK